MFLRRVAPVAPTIAQAMSAVPARRDTAPPFDGGRPRSPALEHAPGLAAVLILAAAVRLPYLASRSFWYDEASSWQTACFPLGELLQSLRLNVHMPLYFLLLKAWMAAFGESIYALRGLSILLGVATVLGMYLCALEIHAAAGAGPGGRPQDSSRRDARWFALAVAALVALSPFQIHASIETRMYALGTALSAFSGWIVLRIARQPGRGRLWPLYGALIIAFLYTHNYAAFSVAAQGLFLLGVVASRLREGDRRGAWRLLGGASATWAAALLAFSPGVMLLRGQVGRVQQDYWTKPIDTPMLTRTFHDFGVLLADENTPYYPSVALGMTALFVAPAFVMLRRRTRADGFLLAAAYLPMAFAALVSLVTPVWHPRYFRFSQIYLLASVVYAFWPLAGRLRAPRIALAGALIANSLLLCVAFWKARDIPEKTGIGGAVAEILARARPGETIICTTNVNYFPAKHDVGSQAEIRLLDSALELFWGGHLIRDVDLIRPGELEKAVEGGVWLIGQERSDSPFGEAADSIETSHSEFAYDNGSPPWPIHVMHLRKPGPGEALERAIEAVEQHRSNQIWLASSATIGDEDLARIERLKGLARLRLDGAAVTDAGLASLRNMRELENLSLSLSKVTDRGLGHLSAIRSLRFLRLDGLPITGEGLARLRTLGGLKELSLWRCKVTDAGVSELAALGGLERLSLDETLVTDRGLRHLAGLENLRYLSLWQTRVSDAGVLALQAARPSLKINR